MSILKTVKVAILCLVLCLLFSAGCDKDKNHLKPISDITLVGTWELIEMSWVSSNETSTTTES